MPPGEFTAAAPVPPVIPAQNPIAPRDTPKPPDKFAGQVIKLPNAVNTPPAKASPAAPVNVPKPAVAQPAAVAKAPPPVDKPKDAPIKDALLASTVLPIPGEKPLVQPVAPKPAGLTPNEPLKALLKDIVSKHDDSGGKPVVLGAAVRKDDPQPQPQKAQKDAEPKPAAPPNVPAAAVPAENRDSAQVPIAVVAVVAETAKKQAAPTVAPDEIAKPAAPTAPQKPEPAAEQKPPVEQKKVEPPKAAEPKPPAPPTVSESAFLRAALANPPKVAAEPEKKAAAPAVARANALDRTILDSEPFKPEAPKAAPVPPVAKPPAPAVPSAKPPVAAAAKPPPAAPPKPPVAAAAKPAAAAAKAVAEEEEMKLRIPLQPGEPLSMDEMKHLEILEGIPEGALKMLYGGIVRREFKRGDIICKQGEYASTAFYVLSGKAEVYILTPDQIALGTLKKKKNNGASGILERLKFWVQGRKEGPRKSITGRRPDIENDQSHLPPELRRAELSPGDLFGEMSCINFYPRSMNVRATEDCVMLEIIRTVLDTIRTRKGKYKEKLEKNYRERSLAQHLNTIPLFKDLDPEFIDQLRKKVKLQDFEPGEIIFRQGDTPDAFYLVRRGCIKVTQLQPGGELVLTYLGQNDSFGEIGLLRNVKRTATCTALDHVEVVKIEKVHFDFLTHCYDEFKARMEKEIDERLATGRNVAARPPARALNEFIDQELMQAQNVLLLDLEKCTRCDECVQACIDSHDDGKTRLVREGLRFDKYLLATSCRSCMDPVCMIGCPVGSIRREETFEIIIEDWCIGCEKCAKQCPYGNIKMHEFPRTKEEIDKDIEAAKRKSEHAAMKVPPAKAAPGNPAAPAKDPALKVALVKDIAVTCDQCSTLQEPSCVYACPHEAAMRVNARDFFEIVRKSSLKDRTKSVKRD